MISFSGNSRGRPFFFFLIWIVLPMKVAWETFAFLASIVGSLEVAVLLVLHAPKAGDTRFNIF